MWSYQSTVSICCNVQSILVQGEGTAPTDHISKQWQATQKCVFCLCYVLQTISLKLRFIVPLSFTFSVFFPPPLMLFSSRFFISLAGIYTTFIGFCSVPSHGLIYRVLAMQPGEMYCGAAPPFPTRPLPAFHSASFTFLYSLLHWSETIFDLAQEVKTGAENTRDRVKHVSFYVMLRLLATKIIYPNQFWAPKHNSDKTKKNWRFQKLEFLILRASFSTRDHINVDRRSKVV